MRTFLYARVSDAAQTLDHQRAQAEGAGFKIDEVIADHGVSGVTTNFAERPGGKRLLDKVRAATLQESIATQPRESPPSRIVQADFNNRGGAVVANNCFIGDILSVGI